MKIKKDHVENLFTNARAMLLASVGRLPTALVVILLSSTAMAAVTAMILIWNKNERQTPVFLQQRLEASETAPNVNPQILQGTWVYQTPSYAMTLTFVGDRFEWIVLFGDIAEVQYYARGNFKIEKDVMVLGIRPDLGAPYDPAKPWVTYMPIGMVDVNFKWSFQNKKFIWDVPSSEQTRIISEVSRIFIEQSGGHFEWSRSE